MFLCRHMQKPEEDVRCALPHSWDRVSYWTWNSLFEPGWVVKELLGSCCPHSPVGDYRRVQHVALGLNSIEHWDPLSHLPVLQWSSFLPWWRGLPWAPFSRHEYGCVIWWCLFCSFVSSSPLPSWVSLCTLGKHSVTACIFSLDSTSFETTVWSSMIFTACYLLEPGLRIAFLFFSHCSFGKHIVCAYIRWLTFRV